MDTKFEELKGKTIVKIEGMEKDSGCIEFFCSDGTKYVMDHEQDCCESVYLEDVCGDKQTHDKLVGFFKTEGNAPSGIWYMRYCIN